MTLGLQQSYAKFGSIFSSQPRMGVRDGAIVYFDGVLKLLGVCHGMLGGLLVILGVVVRLVVDHWTSVMLLALWIGVIVSACFIVNGITTV